MAQALPVGHRRKGSGLTTDYIPEFEKAIALARDHDKTWYVDSNAASGGNGDSWSGAYQSLVTAIAAAQVDDLILVAPAHTEAVTGAGTITVNKAGLKIVGLGMGDRRPIITYTTAAAASFDITAAGVLVYNLFFRGIGVDALTAMINISAAGVTLSNCEIELGDATNQAVLGILTTAAANRLRIVGCFIHGSNDAGTTTAIRLVGGDAIVIEDNAIIGNFTTTIGGIQSITTANTNIIIRNNVITNRTASSSKAIVLLTASTGIISGNALQILTGTAPITGDAASWVGSPANYYAATIATGSTIV